MVNKDGTERTTKATKKQRQVVALLLEPNSEKLSGRELVTRAGYLSGAKVNPGVVLQSKGVQALLEQFDHAGLTDDTLSIKIYEIVQSKDYKSAINAIRLVLQARYQELRPSFKLDVSTQNAIISPSSLIDQAYELIALEHNLTVDQLKAKLSS